MKSKEFRNIIVDTKPEHMHHFLRMILQLQMNDYKYHYLFTTFDIETFDLEDFKYNFVNITAFRLVDADDVVSVRSILRDMERYQPSGNTILNKSRIIQVSTHESSVYRNSCSTHIKKDMTLASFDFIIKICRM
ncbi:Glutamate receptor, ionotropic kainate 1 [Acromyrmex echinatior]|uniref:Glutamate receptor, ionotropic kainate 1 n=1 Tax=Acromyrmex echinatior TaxID=103372 RepID=F4WXW9_ACREC|nr:Glutamate receptor, ionotropic kainate 1 [Acromyrmex echinatior]